MRQFSRIDVRVARSSARRAICRSKSLRRRRCTPCAAAPCRRAAPYFYNIFARLYKRLYFFQLSLATLEIFISYAF
jgi:hypothetical protein